MDAVTQILIKELEQSGAISLFSIESAMMMSSMDLPRQELMLYTLLLLLEMNGQGHVCIELERFAGKQLDQILTFGGDDNPLSFEFPQQRVWKKSLVESPLVTIALDEPAPLYIDADDRLYLYKNRMQEDRILFHLTRLNSEVPQYTLSHLQELIEKNRVSGTRRYTDEQLSAALRALQRNVAIISGGPGTGKTTTAALAMHFIIESGSIQQAALAAPTGKAAQRLSDSVRQAIEYMPLTERMKQQLSVPAQTLHRLLGYRRDGSYMYNEQSLLPYDLIVVDEASMVDQEMMARLLGAIATGTHLVLLGDRDQLASVEAGAVMGDMTRAAGKEGRSAITGSPLLSSDEKGLSGAVQFLTLNQRAREGSGIQELATAIRDNQPDDAMEILLNPSYPGVTLKERSWKRTDDIEEIVALSLEDLSGLREGNSAEEAVALLPEAVLLSPLRHGVTGANNLNRTCAQMVTGRKGTLEKEPLYSGQPRIITRNDYTLGLFNGDSGLLWEYDNRFYFISQDGIRIPYERIRHSDIAYCLTIHKSQGSEYSKVRIVLPPVDSPFLTRELLYTAVTRARDSVELWGTSDIIRKMIERPHMRMSGLESRLRMN